MLCLNTATGCYGCQCSNGDAGNHSYWLMLLLLLTPLELLRIHLSLAALMCAAQPSIFVRLSRFKAGPQEAS